MPQKFLLVLPLCLSHLSPQVLHTGLRGTRQFTLLRLQLIRHDLQELHLLVDLLKHLVDFADLSDTFGFDLADASLVLIAEFLGVASFFQLSLLDQLLLKLSHHDVNLGLPHLPHLDF